MSEGGGPGSDARSPKSRKSVLVLSGPSAVGKSTVVRCCANGFPICTSPFSHHQGAAPGEVDGVDYSFVDRLSGSSS